MNQLSLNFARKARDRGIEQSETNANAGRGGWSEDALSFLREYATTHELFPMYFVTREAEKRWPDVNPKAWGGPTLRAIRLGIIAKTDRTMPHPGRHACPAIVMRSLVYRSAA